VNAWKQRKGKVGFDHELEKTVNQLVLS